MEKKDFNSNEIRVLEFPQSIRTRPGMYIGDVSDTTQLLTELIGNIQDEVSACNTCNNAVIDQNWNGYQICMDTGRGMPIEISKDKPGMTSMEVALTNIHAGSKFGSTSDVRVGQNGCGLKAIVACSEIFVMMSRITPDNFNKSIPLVEKAWNSFGPRSKKDLYYMLVFEKGYKVYEGADKLEVLEKMVFGQTGKPYEPLPRGYSTIAMFKGDPEIFENTSSKIPLKSLQYFLLIQEKLYKRKIELIVNKEPLNGMFKPFKFEMFKTIIPADTSKNKSVSVYVTFEVDPELGQKQETGSVAGLNVDQGVHINYIESCYEQALKNEFKIKHKYITTGLKLCVILIAEDVVFNSQTKEKLKAISKVKLTDFGEVVKEFQKIFRSNQEYWTEHVGKLDFLAESMKSLSTDERVAKMIDDTKGGSSFYRSKNSIVDGYAAASAGPNDRWGCELFLCFTGDTEVFTTKGPISFSELTEMIERGEELYTYTYDKSKGYDVESRIIAAKKIKKSSQITTVYVEEDENYFRCTPDHKIMMSSGEYMEAGKLKTGDHLMSPLGENYGTVGTVETVDREEDVYCLEVDHPDHNFLLSDGYVFVKNCEGLSPFGRLKSARIDIKHTGILALRGKVKNLSKSSSGVDSLLDNKEYYSIFKALNLGVGDSSVIKGCKTREEAYEVVKKYANYSSVIIATDGTKRFSEILHRRKD